MALPQHNALKKVDKFKFDFEFCRGLYMFAQWALLNNCTVYYGQNSPITIDAANPVCLFRLGTALTSGASRILRNSNTSCQIARSFLEIAFCDSYLASEGRNLDTEKLLV